MKIKDLKGKKITVFGLGLNGGGVDTVRFLASKGAKVIATDIKTQDALKLSVGKLKGVKHVEYVLGQHRSEDFARADMVIKTPGAKWDHKQVQIALGAGVPVYVDASLFFTLTKQPVIGITGSKGKTTTTNMIVHLLSAANFDTVPVGVGQTPVLGALDRMTADSVPVFELSSWRLAALGRIKKSPRIAVVTNLMDDHADYYKTRVAYEKDKFYITKYQKSTDTLILNADDPVIAAWVEQTKAQVIMYSMTQVPDGHAVFVKNGTVYECKEGKTIELYSLADVSVSGKHNQSNMLAATAAARAAGVSVQKIRAAVGTFGGVEHRSEKVAEIGGVTYINDTAATIPTAAIASVQSYDRPVVLIAGGADKNLEYAAFANVILAATKRTVLFAGKATEKIVAQICKVDPAYTPVIVDNMTDAVEFAAKAAADGDVVLLAPGAASFGIFDHEFDRGEQFRAAVLKRAAQEAAAKKAAQKAIEK